MKITPTSSLSSSSVGAGKRPAGGAFSLGGTDEAAAPSAGRAMGVSTVGSIDALIALQQVDEPLGRRRRAVGRAGRLLDLLEGVKLKLLDGDPDEGDLQRLAAAVREQRAATQDPGLEALLDQIETRAAVELAKIEARLQAA